MKNEARIWRMKLECGAMMWSEITSHFSFVLRIFASRDVNRLREWSFSAIILVRETSRRPWARYLWASWRRRWQEGGRARRGRPAGGPSSPSQRHPAPGSPAAPGRWTRSRRGHGMAGGSGGRCPPRASAGWRAGCGRGGYERWAGGPAASTWLGYSVVMLVSMYE